MKNLNPAKSNKDDSLMIFVICSLLITAFLFFIDEGNYNFYWMASIGSWLVFIVYAVPIFVGQFLASKLILAKRQGVARTFISISAGSVLGILFVIKVIF